MSDNRSVGSESAGIRPVSTKIRNPRGRWLTVASAAAAVLVLGVLLHSGWRELLWFGPLPLLFVSLVWILFDRPYIIVDDGGVEIANVIRTLRVPWPAVIEVDHRWGLRLVTKLGTFSAWSVPPPARPAYRWRFSARSSGTRSDREHPGGSKTAAAVDSASPAAQLVLERWQTLRAAGYLDNPRLESDRPLRWWNRLEMAVTIGLLLLSAAGVAGYRLS